MKRLPSSTQARPCSGNSTRSASDAAAAIAHLVERGLSPNWHRLQLEPFNISDDDCGTFRDVLSAAYEETGDTHYKLLTDLPVVLDLAKDLVKYPRTTVRYPLGMLTYCNAKLLATGFKFPSTSIKSALKQALAQVAPLRELSSNRT